MGIFHTAESARWLSVAFGCLTIPVIYKLGCQLGKRKDLGLWSAFLLAVSPFHIWYSQEARAYTLFYLIAASALYCFFKAMDDDHRRSWFLFAAFSISGIYIHYYFVVLLICCGLIVLLERRSWDHIQSALFPFLLIGIFCLPSLFLLQNDLNLQENWPGKRPFDLASFTYTYFSFLGGLSLGPSMRELHTPLTSRALSQLCFWSILLGSTLSVIGLSSVRALGKGKRTKRLVIFMILPLLICAFLSYSFQIGYNVRYVGWVALPVYIFLAIGLAEGMRRISIQFSLIILCCIFSVSLYNRRAVGRYMNEDVRSAAVYIMAHSTKGTPAFVQHKSVAQPLRHYLNESWPVYGLDDVGKDGEGLDELLKYLETKMDHKAFWFIYTRPFHGDPGGIFKKTILMKGVARKQNHFSGIELYRGKFPGH
jgi:4-amino-4-deoxy-L-arabinose transferase-like glycosyltransferase